MAQSSQKSVVVVGGGIVGLMTSFVLQVSGHAVTLIARDAAEDTASGVAAGMIAPALEAMSDSDPAAAYERLRSAARYWHSDLSCLPPSVRLSLPAAFSQLNWLLAPDAGLPDGLSKTGAEVLGVAEGEAAIFGLAPGAAAFAVAGEGLFPAVWLLEQLRAAFLAEGGAWQSAEVQTVRATGVRCRTGGWIEADAVIIAAGFGSHSLRQQVPSLRHLTAIKGHILDLTGEADWIGVMRAATGYQARYSGGAKFGATMEAGRDDIAIDPTQVELLKSRAQVLFPDLALDSARPRAGVRAASPDGWPMIGRDRASGVLVATAMRRNGYIFAPLAARMMLDIVEDRAPPEAAIYDPERFS